MEIKNEIIALLEKTGDMSAADFAAMAKSITSKIEEIQNKKNAQGISQEAADIIAKLDAAIKKFGTYSYDDKGPDEVMNIDAIMKVLQVRPIAEIGRILSEVLDAYPVYGRASRLVNCLIGEFDYLPEEEFDELFDCDERFEY